MGGGGRWRGGTETQTRDGHSKNESKTQNTKYTRDGDSKNKTNIISGTMTTTVVVTTTIAVIQRFTSSIKDFFVCFCFAF